MSGLQFLLNSLTLKQKQKQKIKEIKSDFWCCVIVFMLERKETGFFLPLQVKQAEPIIFVFFS